MGRRMVARNGVHRRFHRDAIVSDVLLSASDQTRTDPIADEEDQREARAVCQRFLRGHQEADYERHSDVEDSQLRVASDADQWSLQFPTQIFGEAVPTPDTRCQSCVCSRWYPGDGTRYNNVGSCHIEACTVRKTGGRLDCSHSRHL